MLRTLPSKQVSRQSHSLNRLFSRVQADSNSAAAGLEAANERRFADAERFFKLVLKSEPDSASVWSNIGNVHLSLGHPVEALEDFTRAVSLAPEAPVPYLNRSLAHEQLGVDAERAGQRDQAEQEFAKAIQV